MSSVPTASARSKKGSRLAGFLAVFLLTVLWNAVVLRVIGTVLLRGGAWDLIDWILFLVVLPFALVGLGLAAFSAYLGVPLLNPRVLIEVSPGIATLGEAIEVSWHFEGAVERIPRVVVRLEAREEVLGPPKDKAAPGQRPPIVQQRVLRRVGVIQAATPAEIRSGSVSLRIPADSVPSFNGQRHRVAWYICLHGGSDRWPNVRQELEFTVRPLPLLG